MGVGDTIYDTANVIRVEGLYFWGATPLALRANEFAQLTMLLNIADGKVTIDQGTANTRINFVHVVGASGATPTNTPTPTPTLTPPPPTPQPTPEPTFLK